MNPEKIKYSSLERMLIILVKTTICLMSIYIVCIWKNQPDAVDKKNSGIPVGTGIFLQWHHPREFTADEHRIARHFAADTLPGLLKCGLIKKYERRENGTLLLVAGKIWKARSRFFKDSLLTEVLVYNKVNGYAIETKIADNLSYKLYAQAVSADRKELFD